MRCLGMSTQMMTYLAIIRLWNQAIHSLDLYTCVKFWRKNTFIALLWWELQLLGACLQRCRHGMIGPIWRHWQFPLKHLSITCQPTNRRLLVRIRLIPSLNSIIEFHRWIHSTCSIVCLLKHLVLRAIGYGYVMAMHPWNRWLLMIASARYIDHPLPLAVLPLVQF